MWWLTYSRHCNIIRLLYSLASPVYKTSSCPIALDFSESAPFVTLRFHFMISGTLFLAVSDSYRQPCDIVIAFSLTPETLSSSLQSNSLPLLSLCM